MNGVFINARLALVLCLTCGALHAHAQSRPIGAEVGIEQHLGAQIPLDLEFKDEQGRTIELRSFFGDKPVIVVCVYYRCPMLCNEVLNGVLKSSQAMNLELNKDYAIVTISVDPRETPELAVAKKKKYAGRYLRRGAQEGWRFLTGDANSIDSLTKTVGFRYRYDRQTDQYAHASGIVIANADGKLSHYFYGIDYPPDDLRLALVESSRGAIGSLVDQVLLLCFHYNPKTGRYGVAISAVLRLASFVLVIVGASYLFRMARLEMRRSRRVAAAS